MSNSFCDPMDYSLSGSSVLGISQARRLMWVAVFFSKGSSQPRDQTWVSCIGRQILYYWATWSPVHHIRNLQKSRYVDSNKPYRNGGNLLALRQKKIIIIISQFGCLLEKLIDQVYMNEVKLLLTWSPRHNRALNFVSKINTSLAKVYVFSVDGFLK